MIKVFTTSILLFSLLNGCSSTNESDEERLRRLNQKGEFIYRKSSEVHYTISPPQQQVLEPYPWTTYITQPYTKITKEHFRCKGRNLNPVRIETQTNGTLIRYPDCEGGSKHSLPIVEESEYIPPVLCELLNVVQNKTGSPVVITSGHRCPIHNLYNDPRNGTSKHQIGAEVDFYVQGWEEKANQVIQMLIDYYQDNPTTKSDPSLAQFQRYDKPDSDISTPPWFNKEIFIKLYQKSEGRNFDNRHLYPYIAIQVRYDKERKEKVTFSFDKAHKGYHRW